MDNVPPHAENGKTTFIYALVDPFTMQIRYIGKSNNPQHRLTSHLGDRGNTPKTRWIKSLKEEGFIPELIILEMVSISCWQEREIYWITYYRKLDTSLVNGTNGGNGPTIIIFTDETREKIRQRQLTSNPMKGKKASLATRAKMSIARTGKERIFSEEHRERLRQASLGQKHTPEHNAKIGQGSRSWKRPQRTTPEQKEVSHQRSLALRREKYRLEKLNDPLRGNRPVSETTRLHMSEAAKRKIFTPEHRLNISKAQKERQAREKQERNRNTLWEGRE